LTGNYYTRWLADPEYRASRRQKADLIHAICEPWLASAQTAVDLGAGTGLIRKRLEELARRPIVGFEIDLAFVEDPKRMAVADLERLPLRDQSVAFGIANHVYEHVRDLDAFFAELARVLTENGRAYMTAGNRYALMEPHYRVPTLAWWPEPVATRILRWSGRGERYADINFTTHRRLAAAANRQDLVLDDLTDRVLMTEIDRYTSRTGRLIGKVARSFPTAPRRRALELLSPQWFFLVRHGSAS
jgi:SAM-dependent methyltransferase